MKKAIEEDEMPAEIDFSNAIRGKYASRVLQGGAMVLLEPDVAEAFPDADAVNRALRTILRAGVETASREAEQKAN